MHLALRLLATMDKIGPVALVLQRIAGHKRQLAIFGVDPHNLHAVGGNVTDLAITDARARQGSKALL